MRGKESEYGALIGSFFMFLISFIFMGCSKLFFMSYHIDLKEIKPTTISIYSHLPKKITVIGVHGFVAPEQQKEDKSTYPLHVIAPRPLFRFLGWQQLTDQGSDSYLFLLTLISLSFVLS